MNRGIESFFREAFDGLRGMNNVDMQLIKGAGQPTPDEQVAWTLRRTGRLAPLVGRLTGRTAAVVEQWSSFPSVVRHIRRFRPDVVFYSEANLGFLLHRARRAIGVPFRLLFSNGGPCHPPFVRTDFVHQVAPVYHAEALAAGEPPAKHILVPYGIHAPSDPPLCTPHEKQRLREQLNLPTDRPLLLSVGWISATHKRMDYVVREVASLPTPRPLLVLLGAIDDTSREILDLAQRLLGNDGFVARSVPYEQVSAYYRSADCFVLASLAEGFGRVYLEAMMHGLPTIAHRNPVTEYVLGDQGCLADLNVAGGLAGPLRAALAHPHDEGAARRRWQYVRKNFDWSVLHPKYREMFQRCARSG
jgi:glycosyltransferase involved in cell wall biosynthesis